ncbi:MAG TPA: potassium transporter KefA [Firmicutes bacterium]|nr:potassium transporter KefA [Bacillota bacterium]
MKNKLVYKYVGKVLIGSSILLIFPIIVSLLYKENIIPFIIPAIISLLLGFIFNSLKVENKNLYAKDGFIIVALSWILISIIGSIPFIISCKLDFASSFFEAVSGLTTTGATIFEDVEHLPKSILFWRSFMHFIGGMGVLAFVMAIVPLSKNDKSMHVLKAEMPGPSVAKLVPSIKKTLFYLYSIYIGLTLLEFLLLIIGGLGIFDSLLISFGTAGTGGFSVLNSSLATYSIFNKWVVTIFMFLFGVNFNIYFLIIMKDLKSALKSEELKTYIIIFISSIIVILLNTYHMFSNISEAILETSFHISSIMTSTGYSIGNINIYPTSCRIIILLLMLISACAGSTCGGFKISRLLIILKTIKRDILKVVHPSSIRTISFEGKVLDESTIKSTKTFMFLYGALIILIMFIVSFDSIGLTLEQTINAVFTTFANVGLCFDISNFALFSPLSKIVLSIGMLLGRLEIFPLIVLFTRLRK